MHMAYSLLFIWPDNLLSKYHETLTELFPFYDSAIIAIEKPCQHYLENCFSKDSDIWHIA